MSSSARPTLATLRRQAPPAPVGGQASLSPRIAAFDLMRGYFLVVILVDHLVRFPSLFDPLTGRAMLWVTAAEGFFFLSGLLIGQIRRRTLEQKGPSTAAREMWSRAAKLYVSSVVLTLAFTLAGQALVTRGVEGVKGGLVFFGSTPEMLRNVLTFNYAYGYADFLIYYVVFLLLAPGALLLLRSRLGRYLPLALLGLWGAKFALGDPKLFQYATWGTYFFLGVCAGYNYGTIEGAWRNLSTRTRVGLRRVVVGLAALTVATSFILAFAGKAAAKLGASADWLGMLAGVQSNGVYQVLFGFDRGGLLRLPMFVLWFLALFFLVRRFEAPLMRSIGWLLVPLGRNSLYVYILQSIIVFTVPLLSIAPGFLINTLINTIAILLLWIAVRTRFLFGIIPR